jgi:hypothetical protein
MTMMISFWIATIIIITTNTARLWIFRQQYGNSSVTACGHPYLRSWSSSSSSSSSAAAAAAAAAAQMLTVPLQSHETPRALQRHCPTQTKSRLLTNKLSLQRHNRTQIKFQILKNSDKTYQYV